MERLNNHMDNNHKAQITDYVVRIFSWLAMILPPLILANITLWASSVIAQRKVSIRARIAIALGSLGLASAVHWGCRHYGYQGVEWICIYIVTFASPQILKFAYLKFGDMVKEWVRQQLEQAVNVLSNKKK